MGFLICGARRSKSTKAPSTKGSGSEGCNSIVCDMVCDMVPVEILYRPSSFEDDASQVSMLTSEYIPSTRSSQPRKRRRKRGFR